jgi:hypothetical protein
MARLKMSKRGRETTKAKKGRRLREKRGRHLQAIGAGAIEKRGRMWGVPGSIVGENAVANGTK